MSEPIDFSRISLEQARKQAKELVKAHAAGDPRALDAIRWTHPRFRDQSSEVIARGRFALADAQLIIARRHHFESWRALRAYVETIAQNDPTVRRFEEAADRIVAGDVEALRAMLTRHPALITQRSTRAHHSTLLHYVSANGVEDYRQLTPANVLDVTRVLLDAGADVNATSDAYGGGSSTLGLVSTSAHPRARGVQIALIDLLLERGAKIDGEDDLPNLVSGALGNGCPEAAVALAARGARVNTLYAAAGIGDLDRVRALFAAASRARRERAMIVAAQQGHREIVRHCLDHGVDVSASDGMTALHNASAGGHQDLMAMLIDAGADLEALNVYGGTVLSSTIWFAYHVIDQDFRMRNYPQVIEFLIAAGANTDFYPDLRRDIDGVSQRARALGAASTVATPHLREET
jgi:Ankyrin repeats (3 copies)